MLGKSFLTTVAIGVLGLFLAGAGLWGALRREPGFYQKSFVPPGVERARLSRVANGNFANFMNSVFLNNGEADWASVFTAEQVNSYLEEDFIRSGTSTKVLPEGWHSPRVAIEPDRLRIAFRYGEGALCSVISLDMRLWLLAKESNVIALEVLGLRAGVVPMSSQTLLDAITEAAHQFNVEVKWYRHKGNPVAILRWQGEQGQSRVQLHQLELQEGKVLLGGRSLPEGAPRTEPQSIAATAAMWENLTEW